MRYSKWIGLAGILLVALAAVLPWVYIESKNITVTGLHSAGTNFGKPALMNLMISAISAAFFLLSSVMAKRVNVFLSAFNFAWSLRNFYIVSACRVGECPEKHAGLYLLLLGSVIMIVAALFPDVRLKEEDAG